MQTSIVLHSGCSLGQALSLDKDQEKRKRESKGRSKNKKEGKRDLSLV